VPDNKFQAVGQAIEKAGQTSHRKGRTPEHHTLVARYEQLVAAGRLPLLPTGNVREWNAASHQHWLALDSYLADRG